MTDATATADETPPASAPAGFLVRAGLIMGGWTLLHLAVAGALTHRTLPGGLWTLVTLGAFLLGSLALLLRSYVTDAYPGAFTRLFVQRPFWYAQIFLFPMSAIGALGWLAGLPFGRALAWGHALALGAGGVIATLALVGYIGSRALVVRRLEFRFPDLPVAFNGVTLAQLSDLHVGPHTSERMLRRIVRAVEHAKPDLVVFTGDQVDDHDRDVERFGRVFGVLRAPLGSFAIAGNHDVYAGWKGVRAGLEAAGIRVLVNDAQPIRRGSEEFWLAGTGDPAGFHSGAGARLDVAPDIPRTLANVPQGAFVVALAHNPALWPALAQRGVHLTLSGHTHHGQLSVPALRWSLASPFLEFAMGTYDRGGSRLYVNPGTNYWALPLRVGAWPEITLVTLRRG